MRLIDQLKPLPNIDKERARPYKSFLETLSKEQKEIIIRAESTLKPILSYSSYLFDLSIKNTDFLINALNNILEEQIEIIKTEVKRSAHLASDKEELQKILRRAKSKYALLLAIAELGDVISTKRASAILAEFADISLELILDFLISAAAKKGKINLPANKANAANCGLAIFALGKHGGCELNYSSDIDIVAFFDLQKNILPNSSEAVQFYSRIMRSLVSIMEDRSADGYVFRCDLRLRPDPGSTPVAISVDAALSYYESRGQNWERAAWIKARPAAGDKNVAKDFLRQLVPFIWRKHLDFATIADIQAMKRQINISKTIGQARVEGHNVKLGRGGIREIEFFVQTQQLIAGGRDVNLRERASTKALKALAKANWISKEAEKNLTRAYWYLRAVENRLQMLRDEQTHIMPEKNENIAIIANLMGEGDVEKFKQKYRNFLASTMKYYADLFAEQTSLASDIGNLVFTGTDDDPATLDSLEALGFRNAKLASSTIRKWHYGSYPATRASAARAHLTELLPSLLRILAKGGNADEALARFDHFLSKFPAGVELFSLLRNNENICQTLVTFMASAPRMAEKVIQRAHVMDGMIDPAFVNGISDEKLMRQKIEDFLAQANSFEDLIDRARIIGQEQKFLIGAGFIAATISAERAGEQFTNLAQTLLQKLFLAVQKEFIKKHGIIRGAKSSLLAFGKMASREMTATSDLDFILLYDAPEHSEYSDGEKKLALNHYYSRLTQRLLAALSAPTAEGVLYEADMRLRPSGNAGPLATSFSAFVKYQKEKAWTWEHLALTRARIVVSEGDMKRKVHKAIDNILAMDFAPEKIITDVKHMQSLIRKERKAKHKFDLKLIEGGLIDIEFLVQSAQLLEGKILKDPRANIGEKIRQFGRAKIIKNYERLAEIHNCYSIILQAMSICLPDPLNYSSWSDAFKDLLAFLTNYPNFELLENDITKMAKSVTQIANEYYQSKTI